MSESSLRVRPPRQALNPAMARRRAAILDQARRIIGRSGFSALTLRDLARAAEVTVPTIYNLVGNKNSLLLTLLEDLVHRLEASLTREQFPDPLTMAEAVIIESTRVFQEDEDFSRAALLVAEHVEQSLNADGDTSGILDISQRAVQLPINACLSARDAGLLRGTIAAEELGRQIYRGYRTAWRDWAYRLVDNETFRNEGLRGTYICLAADAVPAFHQELTQRIAALDVGSSCGNATSEGLEHDG
ncbi:MAG: TetR/AcrR family transcriptional regulator [Pseudomonadota bacterium]